ncbi:MAG: 4'-phosphopantetheinyl transferase superfamily protein [Rikenellaceae bacterium]
MNNLLPLTISLPSGGVVLIDKIGALEELLTEAPQEDLAAIAQSCHKRQREQLTWRRMVRKHLAPHIISITYNEAGAPQIGSELHLGVSHSASLAAIIISHRPCSIDIEALDRDFSKVAPRYITPSEALLREDSDKEHLQPLLWSAKETLYKYANCKELSLLDDIRIHEIGNNTFTGSIKPHDNHIEGVATTLLNHSLVYVG